MAKYNVGDEVEISFKGMVYQVSLVGEIIFYDVKEIGNPGERSYSTVNEAAIFPLPKPEDFKK